MVGRVIKDGVEGLINTAVNQGGIENGREWGEMMDGELGVGGEEGGWIEEEGGAVLRGTIMAVGRVRGWMEEGGEKGGDAELGSFLSSANEPTITRQLNVLSNIVKRAFLFGGDSELRVLAETLEEEKSAFVKRWYGGSKTGVSKTDASRDGVAYLEALILLCRVAYQQGIVDSLIPYVQLNQGYGNSYERLAASLVEMGSGYVKIKQGEIKKK